jgi:hypothetical protein
MRARVIASAACAGLCAWTLAFAGVIAASPSAAQAIARNTITASPNPARLGKTTITWQSTSSKSAVFVSEDGHAPLLFAASPSGSSVAAFVVAGHSYRFSLCPSGFPRNAVASVVVTGATGIGASPNPAPAGKTRITWQSTSSTAVVRVSVNGRGDTLFAAGASGTSVASFIGAGSSYRFSLYASSHSHSALASIVVKR